jgi:hypothetical protein
MDTLTIKIDLPKGWMEKALQDATNRRCNLAIIPGAQISL